VVKVEVEVMGGKEEEVVEVEVEVMGGEEEEEGGA
jgi:hypothetical protein